MTDTILVENVNHPGNTRPVNRGKYDEMKKALLVVAPAELPGLEVAALKKGTVAAAVGDAVSGWGDRRLVAEMRPPRP